MSFLTLLIDLTSGWLLDAANHVRLAFLPRSGSARRLEHEVQLLRRTLQRFPRWPGGHLKLGQLALLQNNSELAHNCGILANLCAVNSAQRLTADWLIAAAQMRLGALTQAAENLESLIRHKEYCKCLRQELRDRVEEDFAAALIAINQRQMAREVLERIGKRLSAQGQAALAALLEKG